MVNNEINVHNIGCNGSFGLFPFSDLNQLQQPPQKINKKVPLL